MSSFHPLVQDLMQAHGLRTDQAQGLLGLLLRQLENFVSTADFQKVRVQIPDLDRLLKMAPQTGGGGLLGGLARSLGGDKGKLLVELQQGLRKLDIPFEQAKPLLNSLRQGMGTHYPDLLPLIEGWINANR